MNNACTAPQSTASSVCRIEVRPRLEFDDPRSTAALRTIESAELSPVPTSMRTASIFLIEGSLSSEQAERIADELLADQVTETAVVGVSDAGNAVSIEVHHLPGVMDPAAESIERAVRALLGVDVRVCTGTRYDFSGIARVDAERIAGRCFANTVVHAIHTEAFCPTSFPHGVPRDTSMPAVPVRDLDADALARLSREGHLFLDSHEMQAIQNYYRALEREPTEIELETLAQTWSEHCVHKTLKARYTYRESPETINGLIDRLRGRAGHSVNDDGSITINNLLKATVVAATERLIAEGIDWCLSVFVDNAGIIAFDDDTAVCFKAETHNHPSAIEPYGGAATGIGGCIRDVMGTGLAARPIAATDIFCVARPDGWRRAGDADADSARRILPEGCLHPRRILTQVVAGVRDYGNRMGIPTINGAVWFDDDYVGNPLVFCGCVGVMPRDRVTGDPRSGDHIVALGGRTGRDGIHGATFSSAELTDTHADEFSHAVQIGNPVTEKKTLDAILEARDHSEGCLFSAITDCGAGGFSSAVGEMGEQLGATVHLDRAPLKYDGLTATEIWISEAQERMVLAVAPDNIASLQAICDLHDVELCDLGTFGTEERELVLYDHGNEVGRMSMEFLHDGIPGTTREACWTPAARPSAALHEPPPDVGSVLKALLAHPNIASKHWIISQYDHEVQGRSVVRPLAGPLGQGPSDAAVVLPVPTSTRGLAIGNGLATGLRDDPYVMTLAAMDECVRNLVCVGADPERIAVLDNFCWPGCDDAQRLGALVRAAEACYDGAIAYRTPFISGKDSLNNQFTTDDGQTIRIPATLLISGFGIVPDIARCQTMDAKAAGDLLVIVGETDDATGGSHVNELYPHVGRSVLPTPDTERWAATARAVASAIHGGHVRAAHDCSDGGLLVAAAEMAFAGALGVRLDMLMLPVIVGARSDDIAALGFAETPGRYLLEVPRAELENATRCLGRTPFAVIGEFNDSGRLTIEKDSVDLDIDELRAIWRAPLDW